MSKRIVGVQFIKKSFADLKVDNRHVLADTIYPVENDDGIVLVMRDDKAMRVHIANVEGVEVVFFEEDEGEGFLFVRE